MQSIKWNGISQDTQMMLCSRAKVIILDYLKFKILGELIDEVWFSSHSYSKVFQTQLTDQSSVYDLYSLFFLVIHSTDCCKENQQFVVEIMINSVLSNTYDAITRSMLIRICQQLLISYETFCIYEHKLLNCLCVVISSLSKKNDSLNKNAKSVNVTLSFLFQYRIKRNGSK